MAHEHWHRGCRCRSPQRVDSSPDAETGFTRATTRVCSTVTALLKNAINVYLLVFAPDPRLKNEIVLLFACAPAKEEYKKITRADFFIKSRLCKRAVFTACMLWSLSGNVLMLKTFPEGFAAAVSSFRSDRSERTEPLDLSL